MSYGMSRDEYWNGDIYAAFDYLEAEQQRLKRLNEQLWLQGMYVCDAVAVAVNNTVCMAMAGGKGQPMTYRERPYGEEPTKKEIVDKEENETLQAKLWMQQLCAVGAHWGKDKENGK